MRAGRTATSRQARNLGFRFLLVKRANGVSHERSRYWLVGQREHAANLHIGGLGLVRLRDIGLTLYCTVTMFIRM
jgi:hypothetical protein